LNYIAAQGIGEALMLGAKANLDLNTFHSVLMNSVFDINSIIKFK
jgi:3-hydroxyisobutyrate dehydrogenase-like beta-hydroxyacid dehydrogenase